MRFRSFLNSDPPAIAQLWNRQPPQRGLARQVSLAVLEQLVFSKPYFDRHGFIVAEHEGTIVGFVHAGFGPNETMDDISHELGVTCLLLVDPAQNYAEVAPELLHQSESYLKNAGAKLIYGGGIRPINPFYLGLYGGSELPGVLASDRQTVELYRSNGYEEIDGCLVLHRPLKRFRPPVNRQLLQLKREYRVEPEPVIAPENWWAACTAPPTDPTKFCILPIDEGSVRGHATFWPMEPLAGGWNEYAVGLVDVEVDDGLRRRGLAVKLNSDAMTQLEMAGVSLVEVQVMRSNQPAIALYQKLGFAQVDQGIVFRKQG